MDTITADDMAFLGALLAGPMMCLVGTMWLMIRDAMKPAKRDRRVMRWMDRV